MPYLEPPRRAAARHEVKRLPPEVPEGQAHGLVGRLYADIRGTTGAPGVNLFFRELAAVGSLPDVWASVRPLYASGELQAAGARLRALIDPPVRVLRIDESLGSAVGMSASDLRQLYATVRHFAVTNAMNLVMVSALLDEEPSVVTTSPCDEQSRETRDGERDTGAVIFAREELLPLPSDSEIDGTSTSRMDAITALVVRGRPTLRPTLLRHLAHWPALLGAVGDLVMANPGVLNEAAQHAEDLACREASALSAPSTGDHVREMALRFRPAMSGFLALAESIVVDDGAP